MIRRFTDGHTERWWAAELTLFGHGPNKPVRAVCATTERRALPALSTWYLTTNLSREQAPLGEVVQLYGLRNWVEHSYKQMKDELGWAGFMVQSDRAIRRHWTLVCCAFAFCWWHAAGQRHPGDSSPAPVDTPIKPRLLRAVRAWLTPPAELTALLGNLNAGHGINPYLRI